MASADKLSDDALKSVADQLGAFLGQDGGGVRSDSPPSEVGESFAVCFVEARALAKPPADLAALVRTSGVWHHQIRVGDVTTHMARSTQSGFGGGEMTVQQSFESPVAAKIDDAIAWVDKHVKGRSTVRLLVIPAFFVHAFAIVRENSSTVAERYTAVLIDQPAGFTRLAYETEYPLAEFLKLLAKEKPAPSLT